MPNWYINCSIPEAKTELSSAVLRARRNFEENFDFYIKYFDYGSQKLYIDMSVEEKNHFKDVIAPSYYSWLGLTPEMLSQHAENEAKILNLITQYLLDSNLYSFLRDINEAILDSYRIKDEQGDYIRDDSGNIKFLPSDESPQDIYSSNTSFISSYRISDEDPATIGVIRAYVNSQSSTGYKMRF